MAPGPDELLVGERPDALSIAGLYDQVELALARAFPRRRSIWVRGEIQHISDQRAGRGHCYMDLVDPDSSRSRQAPILRVKCWQSTWGPLRATLAREGLSLAPGMVVLIRGTLDFYRPKAEVGFILTELDVTALLGRLAAQRAALLRALQAEGLVDRNRALPLSPVPLRIGLVASPGTEGFRDFLGQLEASGLGFQVRLVPARVQGGAAPGALATAVRRLSALGPDELDLIVVVRGGGSKADLSAFDAEAVARAIATASVPVWTGIGHTGDESLADVVASRACVTPTDCGRELVQKARSWWALHVCHPAAAVGRRAVDVLGGSQRDHETARDRLGAMARHHLDRQSELVHRRGSVIMRCAPRLVEDGRSLVVAGGTRVGPLALAHLERSHERLAGMQRLLAAYDVERQLERGYTLTLDAQGRVVRNVATLTSGDTIETRFADGSARSVVAAVMGPGKEAT